MRFVSLTLSLVLAVSFFTHHVHSEGYSSEFTPPQGGTAGQPWPMPQIYQPTASVQRLNKLNFQFVNLGQSCTILEAALDRYFKTIFYPGKGVRKMEKKLSTTLKFQVRRHSLYSVVINT